MFLKGCAGVLIRQHRLGIVQVLVGEVDLARRVAAYEDEVVAPSIFAFCSSRFMFSTTTLSSLYQYLGRQLDTGTRLLG